MQQDWDVVIAGGGPAGLVAALAAARNNAKVLLIERYGFLGGSATMPMPILGFTTSEGERMVGGIPEEIVQRLRDRGGAGEHHPHPVLQSFTSIDGETLKSVADEMAAEDGVVCLLHSYVAGVRVARDRIIEVIVEGKGGCRRFTADTFVDATGDADLAALAGAPFHIGRDGDGMTQSITVQFQVGKVDIDQTRAYVRAHPGESVYPLEPAVPQRLFMGFQSLVAQARARDMLKSYPRSYVIFHTMLREDLVGVNTTKANLSGLDAGSLTRAEIEGREQAWEVLSFLREYIPGFADSYLLSFPTLLGVRETRRIDGEYVLTSDDITEGRVFPDTIAKSRYPIDIHDPSVAGPSLRLLKSPYGIPYTCLIPQKVNNLLVAGRCISATHEALASARVMATCMAMGQAAGTAAAICAQEGKSPKDLDGIELRRILRSQGAMV